MNQQILLKQYINEFSTDNISNIRKLKSCTDIDFSFDNFRGVSIGFEKDAHLNYFKIFYNRSECETYFHQKEFFMDCLIYERFDLLKHFSKKSDYFIYHFSDLLLELQNTSPDTFSKIFDYKAIFKIIGSLCHHLNNEKLFQSQVDEFLTFIIKNKKFNGYFFYVNTSYIDHYKKVFLNNNISFLLDFLNNLSIISGYRNEIKKVLIDNLDAETLNKELISQYKSNSYLYKNLTLVYNLLIQDKLMRIHDKEVFENQYTFFIDKLEELDSFYTLNFSKLFNKSLSLQSEIVILKLIEFDFINFANVLQYVKSFNSNRITEKFTLFLLNLNLFEKTLIKNAFINNFDYETCYSSYESSVNITFLETFYHYFNNDIKFTKEENFKIIKNLFEYQDEYDIYKICFNNSIDEITSKELIMLINTSLSNTYSIDDRDTKTKLELYLDFMLNNKTVLGKIKHNYKEIKFNSKEQQNTFYNKISIFTF
jgi:hypothetical protein